MILDFSKNNFRLIFEITEDNTVILKDFSRIPYTQTKSHKPQWCSIADIHVCGENPDDHHFFKHTGASRSTTLKYVSHDLYQTEDGERLEFHLQDSSLSVTVIYCFYHGIDAIRTWLRVENISEKCLGLEYVSSFSYTGIDEGDAPADEKMRVFLPHNAWMREVNWKEYSLSELGFERTFKFSSKRISVTGNGSFSSKEYLPMGAVSNLEAANTLMWQIENNGAWHWEISDIADMLYLKLSGPTEQDNHWYKCLEKGEVFESVPVCVAVAEDFDRALAQMTAYRRKISAKNEFEKQCPVIFNDYMHCLKANPTEATLLPVIDRAAEIGAEYYCMDAGWYASGTWWECVGEWLPVESRFPHGIKYIFDYIRSKGMIPGIWLEIEVMGIQCPLAKQFGDECFFMRHGKRVIDHGRYLLDFRNKKVRDYAMSVVDRVVTEYGVGYIKIDFNVDGGIGTEVLSDSFGDGLLEHNRAYLSWLKEVTQKYPQLTLENCASGGLRMDYAALSVSHVQSVSDQSEYLLNAHISAAASTAVLPEQAAIWSYPREGEDTNAAAINMVNSLLQRIQISGQIWAWSEETRELVKEAVTLYKRIRKDIPKSVPFYPLGIPQYTDQWLVSAYDYDTCVRMAVWRLKSDEDQLVIPLNRLCKNCQVIYPLATRGNAIVEADMRGLRVQLPNQNSAMILEVKLFDEKV